MPSALFQQRRDATLEYELTPDAIDLGLDAALPPVVELECKIGEFGRGERNCAVMSDAGAVVRFVRGERITVAESVKSA